jgi:hypothetical protein
VGRKVEELEVEGAKIFSQPLEYEDAEDLLPEVIGIVGGVFDAIGPALASGAIKADDEVDIVKILPLVGGLASQLSGGRLKRLAPKILACTYVIAKDGRGEESKWDLVTKEHRAECFDLHPSLYFAALWHAGRVTFGPFLRVTGLLGKKGKDSPKAKSS